MTRPNFLRARSDHRGRQCPAEKSADKEGTKGVEGGTSASRGWRRKGGGVGANVGGKRERTRGRRGGGWRARKRGRRVGGDRCMWEGRSIQPQQNPILPPRSQASHREVKVRKVNPVTRRVLFPTRTRRERGGGGSRTGSTIFFPSLSRDFEALASWLIFEIACTNTSA